MSRRPLTRKGEHTQKIDYSEAEQLLRAGATQAEVAEKFGVTQAGISRAISRGMIQIDTGRAEGPALPWSPITLEHRNLYPARILRAWHRRQNGLVSSAWWESKLDTCLETMEREGWVWDYDPEEGFSRVPRRHGVDLGLVREPDLDDRGRRRRRTVKKSA